MEESSPARIQYGLVGQIEKARRLFRRPVTMLIVKVPCLSHVVPLDSLCRPLRSPPGGRSNSTTVGKWRTRFAEQRLDGLQDEVRPGKPGSAIRRPSE